MKTEILIAALCASALSAGQAFAQAVYKWVDANGKTVYSDNPPPGAQRAADPARAATPAPANQPSGTSIDWQEKERQFRVRKIEQDAVEQRERQARDKRCEQARRRDAQLGQSDGVVLYRTDKNGERSFIDDSERNAMAQNAKQAVADNCRR